MLTINRPLAWMKRSDGWRSEIRRLVSVLRPWPHPGWRSRHIGIHNPVTFRELLAQNTLLDSRTPGHFWIFRLLQVTYVPPLLEILFSSAHPRTPLFPLWNGIIRCGDRLRLRQDACKESSISIVERKWSDLDGSPRLCDRPRRVRRSRSTLTHNRKINYHPPLS